ncbi:putative uncharacterized protein C20orf78 [Piliocolobus tephrosceles]|uniref:putative uncharacterized protein C20orf78 n=1 Tax=Piliocolobus tephrosceles TaxID=591936 RepID=UPI000E6B4589|nr:putative uncharacterized protein C20orf78 [Piliocolobus tephrosceles]
MFQVFKPHAGEDYKYPRETETIWSHPYIVEGYPKNPLERRKRKHGLYSLPAEIPTNKSSSPGTSMKPSRKTHHCPTSSPQATKQRQRRFETALSD